MAEAGSEEVTSRSFGAVVPDGSGDYKAGCLPKERGAVIVAVWREKSANGFLTVSARHGLRTDLHLRSCFESVHRER